MNDAARPSHGSPRPGWHLLLTILLLLALGVATANLWFSTRLARKQQGDSHQRDCWVLCQPGYDSTARKNAFLLLTAEGNKEWRSALLADLNLEKASLPGAQLRSAAFPRSNFAQANLSGAALIKSSFEMADLSGADLSKADLSEAQLYRTNLKGAKLNRALLRGANLQEVKAQDALFLAADLGDSDCLMADFTGASLAGANLTGARLEGAKFARANLSLARLQDANIQRADFSDCNWWRARGLTSAQLDSLRKNFPPGPNASPALKQDFESWSSK